MRSGFILLSVFVFSVSSAQYKGQNIRVDSLKANAMILQSGELPLGWPQDTLRVVIDTVNSIAPKVNKLYTGDDDEGGILPPSMVRDSIRYAIENAVGGGIPMPDTTEQGGKFLRYNGTEETPFDWAVAGSDDTLGFATVGPERPAGALHATSSYRVKSIATDTIVGGTDTDFYGKKTIWWDRNAGLKAPSVNLGVIWLDTATTRIGDETWFKVNVMKMSSMYGGFAATNGMNFVVSPRRGNAAFNFSDLAFDFNNNDIMPFMTQIVPHQLLMVNRFTNFTPSGNPASPYTAQDDIGAIGANMSVNSHYAIQPAQVKAIDARVNIGGAMPWELGTIGYAANGSYTPALAISGHFELNNYARSEIPTAYGVRARINNAHNNDSTRYGFAAGFKFSQPFWAYGGYDTLYGAHFDDPKYGDVRAAIGLRDTGLIAWKWDTFLKRTSAGTLGLDTNLTVTGTTTTANATVTGTTTLNTSLTGTLRASSGVVSATASDTVGLAAALAGKSGPVDSANFVKRDEIFRLNVAGLVDSIKTSDTLFLGYNVAGYTLDTIRYFSDIGKSLTARIEMVDSLYQRSGATLIDTTTCTLSNTIQAGANIDSATLTQGKVLRVVFPTVGTMPRQFIIVLIGHRT